MRTRNERISLTDNALWGRLLGPMDGTCSPEAARAILGLKFPKVDQTRMRALAEKARNRTLTSAEQEEVEAYSRVGSILGILKSKARVALKGTANEWVS